MNGVPKYMAYCVGQTGKNRRKKLLNKLSKVVPDKVQRDKVRLIMDELAILYHLQHSEKTE